MASSESKAKTESDVTPAGEETWHFDDDTSKGEGQEVLCYSYTRGRSYTEKLFSDNLQS